jgi:acyl-CoA thioester hydrolase
MQESRNFNKQQEISFSLCHRVYYYETDKMGRVYHSNFVLWMEKARTEFLRNRGISYKELEESGVIMPVTEIKVNYLSPVEYDDEVIIDIYVIKLTKVKVEFRYIFYDKKSGKKFGEATSINIFSDKNGKIIRVNNELYLKFGGE